MSTAKSWSGTDYVHAIFYKNIKEDNLQINSVITKRCMQEWKLRLLNYSSKNCEQNNNTQAKKSFCCSPYVNLYPKETKQHFFLWA